MHLSFGEKNEPTFLVLVSLFSCSSSPENLETRVHRADFVFWVGIKRNKFVWMIKGKPTREPTTIWVRFAHVATESTVSSIHLRTTNLRGKRWLSEKSSSCHMISHVGIWFGRHSRSTEKIGNLIRFLGSVRNFKCIKFSSPSNSTLFKSLHCGHVSIKDVLRRF